MALERIERRLPLSDRLIALRRCVGCARREASDDDEVELVVDEEAALRAIPEDGREEEMV